MLHSVVELRPRTFYVFIYCLPNCFISPHVDQPCPYVNRRLLTLVRLHAALICSIALQSYDPGWALALGLDFNWNLWGELKSFISPPGGQIWWQKMFLWGNQINEKEPEFKARTFSCVLTKEPKFLYKRRPLRRRRLIFMRQNKLFYRPICPDFFKKQRQFVSFHIKLKMHWWNQRRHKSSLGNFCQIRGLIAGSQQEMRGEEARVTRKEALWQRPRPHSSSPAFYVTISALNLNSWALADCLDSEKNLKYRSKAVWWNLL